ncbi:MAG: type I methionyl aminopeptidase [Acidimicrobiaceae bacterium]|nr:type I methionyl aminopeptidase [Acidimicrobiaceae bacterium]
MAKRKRRVPAGVGASSVPVSDPPVRTGLVSSQRPVPAVIDRPPYTRLPGGEPGPPVSSVVRTSEELAAMRRTGALAAEVLIAACGRVTEGITTDAIDRFVHDAAVAAGAYPSPLGYRGFPKSVCTSVNEVICHGIPDSRRLAAGDIVNIDVTVYREGVHGDTSVTLMVGDVDDHSRRLVDETRAALYKGIGVVRAGVPVSEIGRAIETHASRHRLGVVREFIGHGVGTEFHSGLQVPHYYDRRAATLLEEAMTFTIEPMLTLGSPEAAMWDDGWTAVTRDGRRTAQFEHTLACTADGAEILTRTASGECAHELFTEPVG